MANQFTNSQQAVLQLQAQFASLESNIKQCQIEKQNWFKSSDIFHSSSFHTQSDELSDYLKELKNNINRLNSVSDQVHASYLTENIANQFNCFKNLLNSVNLNTKYAAHRGKHKNLQARVKSIAQAVTKSSQALYEELSQLHEYERRLLDMVTEKQALLNQSRVANKSELQQQVLITQQRLGRCRQAITGVEDKIQQLDSRS